MDTRSAVFLREILNTIFHIFLRILHHRGNLVGDNHDFRKFFFPLRQIRVVFVYVDYIRAGTALFAEQIVSSFHFGDRPVQALNHLIRIGQNFVDDKMRQPFVYDEFRLVGID